MSAPHNQHVFILPTEVFKKHILTKKKNARKGNHLQQEWHISVYLPLILPINSIVDKIEALNISRANSWFISQIFISVDEVLLKDVAGKKYFSSWWNSVVTSGVRPPPPQAPSTNCSACWAVHQCVSLTCIQIPSVTEFHTPGSSRRPWEQICPRPFTTHLRTRYLLRSSKKQSSKWKKSRHTHTITGRSLSQHLFEPLKREQKLETFFFCCCFVLFFWIFCTTALLKSAVFGDKCVKNSCYLFFHYSVIAPQWMITSYCAHTFCYWFISKWWNLVDGCF